MEDKEFAQYDTVYKKVYADYMKRLKVLHAIEEELKVLRGGPAEDKGAEVNGMAMSSAPPV